MRHGDESRGETYQPTPMMWLSERLTVPPNLSGAAMRVELNIPTYITVMLSARLVIV